MILKIGTNKKINSANTTLLKIDLNLISAFEKKIAMYKIADNIAVLKTINKGITM